MIRKFKAWDNGRKEWIKDVDLIMDSYGKVYAGDMNNPPMIEVPKEDVVFYTGLNDSKENEVYDGNILYWEINNGIESYVGTVFWSENTKIFKNSYKWLVKYEDGRYGELELVAVYKGIH